MSTKAATLGFFSALEKEIPGFIKSVEQELKKLDQDFDKFLSSTQVPVSGYPFYNFKIKDSVHRYEFALAGLKKENIKIELDESRWELLIAAEAPLNQQEDDWLVRHKGIALRAFNRVTSVPMGSKVISATMENGILTVDVECPREKKAEIKKIQIN